MPVSEKVFDAKTGTGVSKVVHGISHPIVTAFLKLTHGATPTITVELQGSPDGQTWKTLASGTWTDVDGSPQILSKPANEFYMQYRLNITDNTNVTVDAWIMSGGC